MLQKLKKKFKEQKGFTLIELLAVIVILGIIAAIAIPSILGIIGNSKKDAHVANAQQMISAAKMLIASDTNYQTGDKFVTMYGLEHLNYLDPVDSPDDPYSKGSSDTISSADATVSYVEINNGKIVSINLITTGSTGNIKYISKPITGTQTALSSKDLQRKDVSVK